MTLYNWFSTKFLGRLDEIGILKDILEDNFGSAQIIFQSLRSGVPFDVREVLKLTPLQEAELKNILFARIISEEDNNDMRVLKIAKFVNGYLRYVSDKDNPNFMRIEYWADPYTTFKIKKDDCDGYAALILKLMELAGIPAEKRYIMKCRVDEGWHASILYFMDSYLDWFVVEGSYRATNILNDFGVKPYRYQDKYHEIEWFFNEKNAYAKDRKVFEECIDKALNKPYWM